MVYSAPHRTRLEHVFSIVYWLATTYNSRYAFRTFRGSADRTPSLGEYMEMGVSLPVEWSGARHFDVASSLHERTTGRRNPRTGLILSRMCCSTSSFSFSFSFFLFPVFLLSPGSGPLMTVEHEALRLVPLCRTHANSGRIARSYYVCVNWRTDGIDLMESMPREAPASFVE